MQVKQKLHAGQVFKHPLEVPSEVWSAQRDKLRSYGRADVRECICLTTMNTKEHKAISC